MVLWVQMLQGPLTPHVRAQLTPNVCGSHTTALLQENKESLVKVGVANDWICVENEMNETWQVFFFFDQHTASSTEVRVHYQDTKHDFGFGVATKQT